MDFDLCNLAFLTIVFQASFEDFISSAGSAASSFESSCGQTIGIQEVTRYSSENTNCIIIRMLSGV